MTIQEHHVLFTFFGATGDLAKRKLYPALFQLFKKGYLHHHFAVIGTARREWSDDFYREVVREAVARLADNDQQVVDFTSHFYYQAHNVQDTEHYSNLRRLADRLDAEYQLQQNRIFYLAMAPQFFGLIAAKLKEQQLLTASGFNRLIIEKPFGKDLPSAVALNDSLSASFDEDQIFRIDHYLGKEMIQNISALRFSNKIFEALWNNHFIDNIQITLAEDIGVEERAGYYDQSGALRDMVQNHILQILSLVAMEPPISLTGEEVRREKIKVLRSLRLYTPDAVQNTFVRAQYEGNEHHPAYLNERDVANDSRTETFVAGKIYIDNFRWAGVPFYVRTGKRLLSKESFVHVQFKPMAMDLFGNNSTQPIVPNVLTMHIQPTQGFSLSLNAKKIGEGLDVRNIRLTDFTDAEDLKHSPDDYERLILDCINGNPTNFAHREEVELSWRFIDTIRQAWDADERPLPTYRSGSMGPHESHALLAQDNFYWQECELGQCEC